MKVMQVWNDMRVSFGWIIPLYCTYFYLWLYYLIIIFVKTNIIILEQCYAWLSNVMCTVPAVTCIFFFQLECLTSLWEMWTVAPGWGTPKPEEVV